MRVHDFHFTFIFKHLSFKHFRAGLSVFVNGHGLVGFPQALNLSYVCEHTGICGFFTCFAEFNGQIFCSKSKIECHFVMLQYWKSTIMLSSVLMLITLA